MATITKVITKDADVPSGDCWIATWPSMGIADTGTGIMMGGASDRSIQIEGTFGGATVTIQGSNDGTNWRTLSDPQGNALTKTTASISQISEITRFLRPVTSGGAGTSVNVTMYLRGMTI